MRYKSKRRQMKEFIVSKFYGLPYFSGSITTLAGPQLKRVVDLADKLDPDDIHIYETCPQVFEKQVKDKYKYYEDREDINLNFNDLLNAPVTEFIDADLMKTFKTDGKIIQELFSKQVNIDAQQKVFIGTISMRKVKRERVFEWLENLLSLVDNVDVYDKVEYKQTGGKFIYLKKYKTRFSSLVQRFEVYEYSDREGPMLSFRIVY